MGTGRALALVVAASMVSGNVHAAASAVPRESPAKGEKSCLIKQYTSEYLERWAAEQRAKARGLHFYVKTSSYLTFKVMRSGTLGITVNEDTYPGSTQYFMIDGRRFSSRASHWAEIDSVALAALKVDKLIDFTYVDWPHRSEISRKDVFSGFAKAYEF